MPRQTSLGFRKELGRLSAEEESLCQGIGREFIRLQENTNITKVYKMPVLMAFCQDGEVRLLVSNTS